MRGGNSTGGFTIVEVLIVLAISGVILASTMPFINGRQSNAQFSSGMKLVQNYFQSVLNNVANGYYSAKSSIACSYSSSGLSVSIANPPGVGIGANIGCQIIGQAIWIPDKGNSITTIPLVAREYASSYNKATTLNNTGGTVNASPYICAMYTWITANICNVQNIDLTTSYTLPAGISLSGKYVPATGSRACSPSCNSGLLGIFSITGISSNSSNGSDSVDIVNYKVNSNYNDFSTKASVYTSLDCGNGSPTPACNFVANSYFNTDTYICFQGTNSQKAAIVLNYLQQNQSVYLDVNNSLGEC